MAKGFCEICGTDIEVNMCCSGHGCGCMGLPTEPPICSGECYDKLMGKEPEKEVDKISETIQKEMPELAKIFDMLLSKIQNITFRKKDIRRYNQNYINRMKRFSNFESINRTKLPRKIKKKNKKQGILNVDVTFIIPQIIESLEFKGFIFNEENEKDSNHRSSTSKG